MKEDIKTFKECLKKLRQETESIIKNERANFSSLLDLIGQKNCKRSSKRKTDLLIEMGLDGKSVSFDKMQEALNKSGYLINASDEESISLINEAYQIFLLITSLEDLIKKIQKTINSFDVDKVTAPLSLDSLLMFCNILYTHYETNIEILCRCFGMAVNYDASLKELPEDLKETEAIISVLEKYFNPDGSFVYNVNINQFSENLTALKNLADSKRDKDPNDFWQSNFIDLFGTALYKSNATYERNALASHDTCTVIKDALRRCRYDLEVLEKDTRQKAHGFTEVMNSKDYEQLSALVLGSRPSSNPRLHQFDLRNIFNKSKKISVIKYHVDDEKVQEANGYARTISILGKTIAAFDTNKVKDIINFENFLSLLQQAYYYQNLPIKYCVESLGMAVYTAALKENDPACANIKYMPQIKALACYYNEDGTFAPDIDYYGYFICLKAFINAVNEQIYQTIGFSLISPELISSFSIYCMSEEFKKEETKAEPIVKKQKTVYSVDYNALSELKKYYNNGEVIAIPEDMPYFTELLNRCGLSDREKNFIIGLVQGRIYAERAKNVKLTPAERYLIDDELDTYLQAKNIQNTLGYKTGDYFTIEECLKDLNSTCDLLASETDEESLAYLLEVKNEFISTLRDFIKRNTEEVSTNNLIFLGDYFTEDLASLDSALQKRVINALTKIRKESQSNFRRIMTSEKLDYIPYEINSGGVRVPFIEAASGIYVVLGCDIARGNYQTFVNRLIKENANIAIIASELQDPKKRNDILIDSEKIITEFNQSFGGR